MANSWRAVCSHIALGLALLLSLTSAIPASLAIASPDDVKWAAVNIPTEGRAGNWVLAAGSDVQHLTMATDGALYAYARGLTYTLYKSTNGGYGWSYIGNVRDNIVGIATSPHDAGFVCYATTSGVYRSTDGGKAFLPLQAGPGGAGSNNIEITSIDVTWQNGNIVAVGTRDTDSAQFGGVYTLSEEQIISGWVDTNLSGYDVYAVACSPNFVGDRQLVAVVTNETDTYVTTRIGYAGWDATIGNARLNRDNSAPPVPVIATSAAIAFPDNYSSDVAGGNYVQFVAVDTGTANGDVYRINGAAAPARSTATDLNTGSAYGLKNIDVTGLAASGNVTSTRLLAGAASSAQTYLSTDSGRNWTRSNKAPTGGAKTCILMAPSSSNRIYAATSGSESALSLSQDFGAAWNQIGLIDTAISTMIDLAPSPTYRRDNTVFMLTFGGKHSLWRSTDGGTSWERVFSSALANVDSIGLVELSPQYGESRVLFIAGSSNSRPAIWRSSDSGQQFTGQPAFDPSSGAPLTIDAWAVVNDTSLFIASYDGTDELVYHTTNSGFIYSTGAPAGSQAIDSMALSPAYAKDNTILVGNTNGGVYWSNDNGTSFEPLPATTTPPLTDVVSVGFDHKFAGNKTVYAASGTANKGIYRFIIGRSTEWERIDTTLPSGGTLGQLVVSPDGVLYAANSKAGGGMERCLDPAYPLGPVFETVTRGLNSNATLSGLWQSDHNLWSLDTASNKLMAYTDTLTPPPTLTSPANQASGMGSLNNHTIKNISLDWEALKEATGYQWQLSYNTDFSTIPAGFQDTTEASTAHLPTLEPGTTYRWRVRASAPVLSPWSATWSFTTSLDTEVTPIKLELPKGGVSGVTIKPLFQWSGIAGADAYELLLSNESNFTNSLVAKTGDYALPTTTWECNVDLKHNTTYYWKVRAVNPRTSSAWSPVGAFTTEPPPAAPAAPTPTPSATPAPPLPTLRPQPAPSAPVPAMSLAPPQPPQPTPAAPASPLPAILNWAVYLIGALLLAIMLLLVIILVLVVRTRRSG